MHDSSTVKCTNPRNGALSEREAAVRILLLKGFPRVSAGAAQVTGEEAALWHVVFGIIES